MNVWSVPVWPLSIPQLGLFPQNQIPSPLVLGVLKPGLRYRGRCKTRVIKDRHFKGELTDRTTPHRTAQHRTAPHRTVPHRTDCRSADQIAYLRDCSDHKPSVYITFLLDNRGYWNIFYLSLLIQQFKCIHILALLLILHIYRLPLTTLNRANIFSPASETLVTGRRDSPIR